MQSTVAVAASVAAQLKDSRKQPNPSKTPREILYILRMSAPSFLDDVTRIKPTLFPEAATTLPLA